MKILYLSIFCASFTGCNIQSEVSSQSKSNNDHKSNQPQSRSVSSPQQSVAPNYADSKTPSSIANSALECGPTIKDVYNYGNAISCTRVAEWAGLQNSSDSLTSYLTTKSIETLQEFESVSQLEDPTRTHLRHNGTTYYTNCAYGHYVNNPGSQLFGDLVITKYQSNSSTSGSNIESTYRFSKGNGLLRAADNKASFTRKITSNPKGDRPMIDRGPSISSGTTWNANQILNAMETVQPGQSALLPISSCSISQPLRMSVYFKDSGVRINPYLTKSYIGGYGTTLSVHPNGEHSIDLYGWVNMAEGAKIDEELKVSSNIVSINICKGSLIENEDCHTSDPDFIRTEERSLKIDNYVLGGTAKSRHLQFKKK